MNAEWWLDGTELDKDQEAVMRLPLGGDYLILGPPGSGKTNLLLLRANYVAQAGSPDILVVVFGRTLREFILRGSEQYNFGAERVMTSTACFYDLLKKYGHNRPSEDLPFEQVRLELVERVRALRASLRHPPFEAIFLDEAQDFLPEEIDVFCSLGHRVFAVADPKQKLYNGQDSLASLEARCKKHVLTHHYRNGEAICRIADAIGAGMASYDAMLPTYHYPEQHHRSSLMYDSVPFDKQVARISRDLNIQTKAYPGDLFAVICPRRVDVDAMYTALTSARVDAPLKKHSFDEGYERFEQGTQVCITTIHGCKGLEFRAVHAAMLESIRRFPLQRNLAFTLATRAKTSLSMYGDPLPSFLQSAILRVEPLKQLPPLNVAFGRKGT
jgi:superfamily I DNA/RNA helicase